MDDEKLLACATEFIVSWRGEVIYVSRYDNHRNLYPDGWTVCSWKNHPYGDSTNPFYLSSDGVWRYKKGSRFESVKAALRSLSRACPPGSRGWEQIAASPYDSMVA